jgi:hypothetical protein
MGGSTLQNLACDIRPSAPFVRLSQRPRAFARVLGCAKLYAHLVQDALQNIPTGGRSIGWARAVRGLCAWVRMVAPLGVRDTSEVHLLSIAAFHC